MKKVLFSVAVSLSTLLVAAPKPEWISAKADIAVVGVGLNQKDAKIDAAYREAFKAAGIEIPDDTTDFRKELAEKAPGADELLKELFGMSDDWETIKAESILVSAELPSSVKAEDGKAFIYVELPGFKQDATDAALKKLLEEDQNVKVTRSGPWTVIKSEDQASSPDVFMGYRAIPEGYVVAVAATQADADAHIAGKTPLAKDSSLQKLFVNLPKQGSRTMIADVQSLMTRFADEETRQEFAMQTPWLLKMKNLTINTFYEGVTGVVTLVTQMEDAQSAIILRDTVISMKTMFASFMVPQFTGNPNSALSRLCLNQTTCDAKDTAVEMKITCKPKEIAAIFKETQAFMPQVSLAPTAEIGTADDLEDLDIEALLEDDDFDDEEDALTPEEARKILDSLE